MDHNEFFQVVIKTLQFNSIHVQYDVRCVVCVFPGVQRLGKREDYIFRESFVLEHMEILVPRDRMWTLTLQLLIGSKSLRASEP